MASNTIKMRARLKGEAVTCKALIKHPMETGLRKDAKTGEKIPAHYIQEVMVEHNGETVLDANWGGSVSKNPYLAFQFTGAAKGDKVKLSWKDNTGDSDSKEIGIR
jgi:sulfur-oxidizing protein SoxZ